MVINRKIRRIQQYSGLSLGSFLGLEKGPKSNRPHRRRGIKLGTLDATHSTVMIQRCCTPYVEDIVVVVESVDFWFSDKLFKEAITYVLYTDVL